MQPADILEMIAASLPAQALKASFWAYPLVNAGHILGLALFIGAIVPLDLRILGAFRGCHYGRWPVSVCRLRRAAWRWLC